jgi:hypothetical protein
MAGTEKQVLLAKLFMMEEKKLYKSQATIEIIESGPIKISGNIIIKDMKRGTEESLKEVWLCRCGNSENKPFCDESHKKK